MDLDLQIIALGGQSISLGLVASFLMNQAGLKDMFSGVPHRKWILRGVLFLACLLLNVAGSVATGVPIGLESLVVAALSMGMAVMKYEFQTA